VTVRFGGIVALREVSLTFAADQTYGVIGPNGAGKTTLFDVLSGVCSANAGRIVFNGIDVTNRSATWRARQGLRRTFQRQQTFGWLSVEDNLLAATEWQGGAGGVVADLVSWRGRRSLERVRRQHVDEVIELCGLTKLRSHQAGDLPIGSARIVEIARALAARPRILMLDEPTSGLEEREVERVGDLLSHLRVSQGIGIVLVEHDIGFVMGACDRIAVLNLGSVLAEGTPEQISHNEEVIAAYLG
jgi:ABC-type branched-subunit amino acid transport system ATPase component